MDELVYVGGTPRQDVALGALFLADPTDMEPSALRGVLRALDHAGEDRSGGAPFEAVVTLACDMPAVSASSIRGLIDALATHDAAVLSAERDHWSCMAIKPTVAGNLRLARDEGRLAMHRAFDRVRVARVEVDRSETTNVNDQATLARLITDGRIGHR